MPTVYSTADYLALPRPEQVFIIDDLLPVGGAMLMYGDPKIGKSFAALQLAMNVVRGEPFLGFPCHPSHVLYVQLDTPRGLWMHRIEALAESGEPILSPNIFHADRESLNTWPFDINNAQHAALLRGAVQQSQASVVIIDTLKEANQAPENDNTEGQRTLASLVAATQPAALILIHHARKPSDGRPNDIINGARGANYLTGRMDAIVQFTPRTMSYVSRATEGGSVRLDRKDNGFWQEQGEPAQMEAWIENLLSRPTLSLRQRAKELADVSGKSEEACRSILRRADRHRQPPPQ